jgi:hypothetical protein
MSIGITAGRYNDILKSRSQKLHLRPMTKTISLLAFLMLLLFSLPSCRKCFTCTNSCSTCTYRDTLGNVADLQHYCSDTLIYKSLVDTLGAHGYVCVKALSTYSDDWCVNSGDAVNQYLPYHQGNGRYTCTQK